jgi:hypothetical protein
MITSDTLPSVLRMIPTQGIQEIVDQDGEYVYLWLHMFNAGAIPAWSTGPYDHDKVREYQEHGMAVIEMQEFMAKIKQYEHPWCCTPEGKEWVLYV